MSKDISVIFFTCHNFLKNLSDKHHPEVSHKFISKQIMKLEHKYLDKLLLLGMSKKMKLAKY